MGEFRKRYRFNIPPRQQDTERTCKKLLKHRDSRRTKVMKLEDVAVVLGESKQGAKTVTASGGELEVKKQRIRNIATDSGPCFPMYLKTLLYGYVLCSMTQLFNPTVKNEPPTDEPDAQRYNLSTVLDYYDMFGNLVVRDCLRGGQDKNIIRQEDLVL